MNEPRWKMFIRGKCLIKISNRGYAAWAFDYNSNTDFKILKRLFLTFTNMFFGFYLMIE